LLHTKQLIDKVVHYLLLWQLVIHRTAYQYSSAVALAVCCGTTHQQARASLSGCRLEDKEQEEAGRYHADDDDDGGYEIIESDSEKAKATAIQEEDDDLEAVARLVESGLNIAEDPRWEVGPRDHCVVFWSSGTTGSPKGIPKTSQQLLSGQDFYPVFLTVVQGKKYFALKIL
jgi:acyl-coenzyme A synthetase/AMP-(fatty) acid ligase